MIANPLEEVLLTLVASELGKSLDEGESTRALLAVRRELDATGLTFDEEKVLEGERASGDEDRALKGLVSRRMERAVRSGIRSLVGNRKELSVPRIVFFEGGDGTENADQVREKLAETLAFKDRGPATMPLPSDSPSGTVALDENAPSGTASLSDLESPPADDPGSEPAPRRKTFVFMNDATHATLAFDGKTEAPSVTETDEGDESSEPGVTVPPMMTSGDSLVGSRWSFPGQDDVEIMSSGPTEDLRARMSDYCRARPSKGGGSQVSMVGQLIRGKYEITREIGRGGFGAVYAARDTTLNSLVAIKTLNAPVTRHDERNAFLEEAQRLTRLNHPNIVDWKVFDQNADGSYYFVMEYLDGEELEDLIEREKVLDPKRVSRILLQVLSALRHAHHLSETESILHLDLKPKNVFLVNSGPTSDDDVVKLIDLGIGQYASAEDEEDELEEDGMFHAAAPRSGRTLDADKTAKRSVEQKTVVRESLASKGGDGSSAAASFGATRRTTRVKVCRACTPEYASPEQAAHMIPGRKIINLDGRSDLYSLGVMGFKLLSGKLPYETPENRMKWLDVHCDVAPRRIGSMGVRRLSRELARFIDRSLEKDREKRWADTNEAYAALHRIVHPPAWKMVAKVTAPLLLVFAIVVVWALQIDPPPPEFDLRGTASFDAEEVEILRDNILYLGPERRAARLTIDGLFLDASDADPVLVTEKREDAEGVAGFEVVWVGEREVEIQAGDLGEDERTQENVYLRVETDDGAVPYSYPFKIVYLGENSWNIADIRFESSKGSISQFDISRWSVDPAGMPLLIGLIGCQDDDVKWVEVLAGDSPSGSRARKILSSTSDVFQYELAALDALSLLNGENNIRIRVTNLAGSSKMRSLSFEVVNDPLSFPEDERPRIRFASPRGERFIVYKGGVAPRLEIRLNRKASVSWDLWTADGQLFAGDSGSHPRVSPASHDHAIDLSVLHRLGEKQSYAAELRFKASDGGSVLHAASGDQRQGTRAHSIWIDYEIESPRFRRLLIRSSDQREIPFDSETVLFTNQKNWIAALTRDNLIPLEVSGRLFNVNSSVATSFESKVLDRADRVQFPVRMDEDGVYELSLDVFRYDKGEEKRFESPEDESSVVQIVVDTHPGVLSVDLQGLDGGGVIRNRNVRPVLKFVLSDPENVSSSIPTPVDLAFELIRNEEQVASGKVSSNGKMVMGNSFEWKDVPTPWQDENANADVDGTYRLTVSGRDGAGNAIPARTVEWVVALQGPRLTLVEPDQRLGEWIHDVSFEGKRKLWSLSVQSADGNGAREVTCQIREEGGSQSIEPFALELVGEPSEVNRWVGRIPFSFEWSEKTISLTLGSADQFGVPSSSSRITLTLPSIAEVKPERIQIILDADESVPVEAMRLIRGNTRPYPFGGKNDDFEGGEFKRNMPYVFSRSPWGKCWGVEYEAREIQDYYLDEYEVSCRQFVGFVRASDGYQNPDHWPLGVASSRHEQLLRDLEGLDPDLPVTRITWDEAYAYARWVGKRLPSLVEWEFAVRGSELRLYSAFSGKRVTEEEITGLNSRSGAPWKNGVGRDQTPDTMIWNLCSNVAEWTATPDFFTGVNTLLSDRNRMDHARENRLAFLDPRSWPDSRELMKRDRFYVAGGHFQSDQPRFDFVVHDVYRRGETTLDQVGFRCALDAASATESLRTEVPLLGRTRVIDDD